MIKTILLLTPVYISIFWSILLNFNSGSSQAAKRFLGKFMIACIFVYLAHFLYYSRFNDLVRLIEPLYQISSLLVYPLFYIYCRLLFVENQFSFRKHGVYLVIPTVLSIFYTFAVIDLPSSIFIQWRYGNMNLPNLPDVKFLNILKRIIMIVYVLQVVFTVVANLRLINAHRKKARNFYSDLYEIRTVNVLILNIILIGCGITSIILSILGRAFFISEMLGITLASCIFSTMLFIMGWIGFQQNSVNIALDDSTTQSPNPIEESPTDNKQQLIDKITNLFNNGHIHLNTKLTIQDVAQTVGTNRTYVSSIINQNYGVNFCTFVNNYRIEELEKLLKKHPEMTNQMLAESCGFGSVDSLKRAVSTKTGLSITQWKDSFKQKRI